MAQDNEKEQGTATAATLDELLESKRGDASTETGQSTDDAQPQGHAAPDESTQPSWRDVVIGEDAEHGYWKNKKVGDLLDSYWHIETRAQKSERERNEAVQHLELLR